MHLQHGEFQLLKLLIHFLKYLCHFNLLYKILSYAVFIEKLSFLLYFWVYNLIITFPPCLSSLQILPYTSPISSKSIVSSLTNCYWMHICIWIYIGITKYNLSSPCNVACMHIFRANHLALDSQLVCSSVGGPPLLLPDLFSISLYPQVSIVFTLKQENFSCNRDHYRKPEPINMQSCGAHLVDSLDTSTEHSCV